MDKGLFNHIPFPDTGISLYESNHHKGELVSDHYHDHFQVLYALEGEGEIRLDGKDSDFSKDKIVIITPNCMHSIKAKSKLTVLVLAFSIPALKMINPAQLLTFIQHHSVHVELDLFTASQIRPLFRKMMYQQKNDDVLGKLAMPVYLLEIIILLLRQQDSVHIQDANDFRSIQMKEYIELHYFENITAESLSAFFGVSTRYMNDIFKRKFNDTPLQYLQQIRINKAKEVLSQTDIDIVTICFEVGYETLSTFYRTFRKLVGISPNRYRISGKTSDR
ncbi:hypothetical protein A8709_23135 [Paenibacillus pectinilyticus]|uniref:HTH araC/xylS-type domain-containing protein n=1 Tax=Paenibacillus pectinilyticus TaxID=512399 RepID=A0A1C0ZRN9_9BACL|nr:AraC family transcriptional regulator [Paenibacillus pectinilyticus]OCT10732.1 hypothetical protein A8709_23135 [Paenibacillus pectinilyticus]